MVLKNSADRQDKTLPDDDRSGAGLPEIDLKGAGLTGGYSANIALHETPVQITDRLVLRPPHHEDVEAMAQLANNINIARMLTRLPHPYLPEMAEEFVERAASGAVGHLVYAITLAEDGRFIGSCTLHDHKYGPGYEIGYWLGEPYWGKGYATEATRALIDIVFRHLPLEQIYISCQSRNLASRRVIEKCGFKFTGNAVGSSGVDGDIAVDCFIMTRQMWLEICGATP